MKFVIQRVKEARVTVNCKIIGQIGRGLLVLMGVEVGDTEDSLEYFVRKISELRLFDDQDGKMNRCAAEVQAEFLVVSQFTLLGDLQKGRRPSFDRAAHPKVAEPLYNKFIQQLRAKGFKVETGAFAAMMDVGLINDGPVTFIL